MEKNTFFTLIATLFLMVFVFVGTTYFSKQSEDNFNRVYESVKTNTEIAFKHIDNVDKQEYINNVCITTFSNGNFRDGDAYLCKTKLTNELMEAQKK